MPIKNEIIVMASTADPLMSIDEFCICGNRGNIANGNSWNCGCFFVL